MEYLVITLVTVNLAGLVYVLFALNDRVKSTEHYESRREQLDRLQKCMDYYNNVKSSSESNIDELFNFVEPLIEDVYKKDIRLVIETDYPDYDYKSLVFKSPDINPYLYPYHSEQVNTYSELKRVKVELYSKSNLGLTGNPYKHINLTQVINRAAELRKLQDKLCCKPKTKRKK